MTKDFVAVLDIGTTKIVCLVGRKNPEIGRYEIVAYAEDESEGVERGLVFNIIDVSKKIKKLVEKIEIENAIRIDTVIVGIAGQYVTSRQTNHSVMNEEGTLITQELVDKMIREVYMASVGPNEKVLHVFVKEYECDNIPTKNPVGVSAKQLSGKFHLTMVKDVKLANLKDSIKRAGLTAEKVILEPVASAKAVLTDEEMQNGVALLDIGGGTSDLIVFKNGKVQHTAVIPIGGTVFTDDLEKAFKIPWIIAEKIKIEHGSAISEMFDDNKKVQIPSRSSTEPISIRLKDIATVIEERLQEIIDTVNSELEKTGLIDDIHSGIVLTGGGSMLKHIDKFTEFRLGVCARIGKPERFRVKGEYDLDSPKYATAIGLLQKAIEIAEREEQNTETEEISSATTTTQQPVEKTGDNDSNSEKSGIFSKIMEFLKKLFIDDDQPIN